jgi:hypothetical protein
LAEGGAGDTARGKKGGWRGGGAAPVSRCAHIHSCLHCRRSECDDDATEDAVVVVLMLKTTMMILATVL